MVEGQDLDDGRRPSQAGVRPDEHLRGALGYEAIHEILGERTVDLARNARGTLPAVLARVVDVDVETVLMGRMSDPHEAPAEVAAATS
jgi:regulator of protease activity HflC (stomatin/prohibitin superfamily)